jgi:hypothetical protein
VDKEEHHAEMPQRVRPVAAPLEEGSHMADEDKCHRKRAQQVQVRQVGFIQSLWGSQSLVALPEMDPRLR